MKKKILLFAEGVSLAHPTRLWVLAGHLLELGYAVSFATPKRFHHLFSETNGINILDLCSLSTETFTERLYRLQFPYRTDEIRAYLKQDFQILSEIEPDFVIGDFRLSLAISCRHLQIPYANVLQYYWNLDFKRPSLVPQNFLVPVFGRALVELTAPPIEKLMSKMMVRGINQIRHEYKQAPYKNIYTCYSDGDYLFFPDAPQLYKQQETPLQSNHFFIAPLIWKSTFAQPQWWSKIDKQCPVAIVSLGSTGDHKQLPAIVTALINNGFQVAASTYGRKAPIEHPKVMWEDFIPIDQILPSSDLLICNGGTSSTYLALALEKKMVCLPSNMDQYINCSVLENQSLCLSFQDNQWSPRDFEFKLTGYLKAEVASANTQSISKAMKDLNQKEIIQNILMKLI